MKTMVTLPSADCVNGSAYFIIQVLFGPDLTGTDNVADNDVAIIMVNCHEGLSKSVMQCGELCKAF